MATHKITSDASDGEKLRPQSPARAHSLAKVCDECGQPFTIDPAYDYAARYVKRCPECAERHAREDQQRAIQKARIIPAEKWKRICPPDFIATDPHKLPCPSELQKVMAWKYGARGLLLHGRTGTGKSRCGWMLLKREFEAGRTVMCLDSIAGLEYAAKYGESAAEVGRWMAKVIEVDLLMLDDVFKSKLTDSFEAALFTIICRRTEWEKPLIITSNDTGASLGQRMSADRGEPLIRRLREYCTPINFT